MMEGRELLEVLKDETEGSYSAELDPGDPGGMAAEESKGHASFRA